MILEYNYVGASKSNYLLVSDFIPDQSLGLFIAFISIIPIIFYWVKAKTWSSEKLDKLILLIGSIAMIGVYTFSRAYSDEVSVNLEHPFNLLHHGMFSFSPVRMVDGTVEFFYYLLLTPFAWLQSSLMLGNFIIGLAIAWLHLFIVWKLLDRQNPTLKLFLVLCFITFLPLVQVFSDGFGAGLISLVLLLCIYFQIKSKPSYALYLSLIFPLLRPDAILYSFAVILVDAIQTRRIKFLYIGGAILSLCIYFGLVRSFYGHWVPTPAVFKAFKLSMIPMISWDSVRTKLNGWVFSYFHFFCLASLICSFFIGKDLGKNWQSVKGVRYYFPFLTAIFVFYSITTSALGVFTSEDARYYVGLELFAGLFPLLFLQNIPEYFDRKFPYWQMGILESVDRQLFRFFFVFSFTAWCFIVLGSAYYATLPVSWFVTRVPPLGVAGQIADEVIPKGWAIATTELNTFGLMNDREIIDLWGYTNPEIANSSLCNAAKLRNNPNFFLNTKPEIFWWWAIDRPNYDYEDKLLAANLSKYLNQLGNMLEVIDLYQVVTINKQNYVVTFLVRNDLKDQFVSSLTEKGFVMQKSREVDMKKFKDIYEKQEMTQFKCG